MSTSGLTSKLPTMALSLDRTTNIPHVNERTSEIRFWHSFLVCSDLFTVKTLPHVLLAFALHPCPSCPGRTALHRSASLWYCGAPHRACWTWRRRAPPCLSKCSKYDVPAVKWNHKFSLIDIDALVAARKSNFLVTRLQSSMQSRKPALSTMSCRVHASSCASK